MELWQIKLKPELGPLEILTVATTASLGLSVVYNLGFFWSTAPSLVSLLTIQDYAVGAVVGLVPTLAPFAAGVMIASANDKKRPHPSDGFDKTLSLEENVAKSTNRRLKLTYGSIKLMERFPTLILLILTAALFASIIVMARWPFTIFYGMLLLYAAIGLAIVIGVIIVSELDTARTAIVSALLFASTSFVLGLASYDSAARTKISGRLTLGDAAIVTGKMVRMSTNYVFLLDGVTLSVYPIDQLKLIESNVVLGSN
jgi:hypothetical protein